MQVNERKPNRKHFERRATMTNRTINKCAARSRETRSRLAWQLRWAARLDVTSRLRRSLRSTCLVSVAVLLTACTTTPAAPSGDADRGRALFNQPVQSDRGEQQACARCHAIQAGEKSATGLGTNFHDIGARAGTTVQGQSAEDYLRTSIVDPDAYLAGNFQDGLMFREYAKVLTPQQIEDLVAYMLTLK